MSSIIYCIILHLNFTIFCAINMSFHYFVSGVLLIFFSTSADADFLTWTSAVSVIYWCFRAYKLVWACSAIYYKEPSKRFNCSTIQAGHVILALSGHDSIVIYPQWIPAWINAEADDNYVRIRMLLLVTTLLRKLFSLSVSQKCRSPISALCYWVCQSSDNNADRKMCTVHDN